MQTIRIDAASPDAGKRIDAFICDSCGGELTRSAVQKLCAGGRVLVNSSPVAKSYRLRGDERVVVQIPPPRETAVEPQAIALDIVYEDGDLLVVNKPRGMVVHPAPGNADGTLVNALLHHCGDSLSGIGGVLRPGIVHRIDKDTSGLLIVAKNDRAHQALSSQISAHSFSRRYRAVVYGRVREDSGSIDAPLGRHPVDRKKMCVTQKNGRSAVTHFRVVERYPGFTHLALTLETGRTHQIRVHLAHRGHPVAGDAVYGPKKVIKRLGGQCLHAESIGFVHPASGEWLEFSSPLPEYFTRFLQGL